MSSYQEKYKFELSDPATFQPILVINLLIQGISYLPTLKG